MESKEKLTLIWSEEFWMQEAERIEMAYWSLAGLPNVQAPDDDTPTEHRLERFVRDLSRWTNIGNLHVGLTSSDLEDNIRIKRLEESLQVIGYLRGVFNSVVDLKTIEGDKVLIAYTHLMPAGVTRLSSRLKSIQKSNYSRPIVYKGIGGALGDFKIQNMLGLDRQTVNGAIFPGKVCQVTSTQTVDHLTELSVANTIIEDTIFLAKTANDIRQMFSVGQATHIQKDVGSTAIPGKKPNPWRYERVSGMAEMLYDLHARVARIASSCLLERTLTNQSVLNALFKEAFMVLAGMYEDMIDALRITHFIDQKEECEKSKYHTEEMMLEEVLGGTPRLLAHRSVHSKIHSN